MHSLSSDPAASGQTLKENWISRPWKLSTAWIYSARSRTLCPPPLAMLRFSLPWSCMGLVEAATVDVSSHVQLRYCIAVDLYASSTSGLQFRILSPQWDIISPLLRPRDCFKWGIYSHQLMSVPVWSSFLEECIIPFSSIPTVPLTWFVIGLSWAWFT